jgi:iron(III) transport system ATP-binding protein
VVGLEGYQDRKPDEISGGQQQRVAIARALAASPDLLLLDEPFSNIDESMKFSFRRELHEILKKAGTTAIFVTHDTRDALDLGDKVMVIQDGHQVQLGQPEDIYQKPRSPYVAQLLGPINNLSPQSCVRAEHTMISAEGAPNAVVLRSIFQGSVYHVHVRTDEGKNWIASSSEDWLADTPATVSYAVENILTFSP